MISGQNTTPPKIRKIVYRQHIWNLISRQTVTVFYSKHMSEYERNQSQGRIFVGQQIWVIMKTACVTKLQAKLNEQLGQRLKQWPQYSKQEIKSHLFRYLRLKRALLPQKDNKINFLHYFNFLLKNVSDESGKLIKKLSRMVRWHQGIHSPWEF